MPLRSFEQELKSEIKPIYCVIGPDQLVLDRAEELVRQHALSPGMDVFNLAVFRGEDDRVDEALGIARTLPMMSGRRVVVVRNVGALGKDRLEEFLAYAKQPIDSCTLVLSGEKLD